MIPSSTGSFGLALAALFFHGIRVPAARRLERAGIDRGLVEAHLEVTEALRHSGRGNA